VSITLPADHVTGATGVLTGVAENLNGTKTVHYWAEDVVYFAWTAAPHVREVT
jgi:hypothetical protein